MMSKNAIVLTVDGLGTGFLGPYGISSCETDAFNRLASQSIIVDHAMADASDLELVLRSMCQGGHAGYSADWYSARPSLSELASDCGIHSVWFSDQLGLNLPGASDFRRQIAFSESLPTDEKLATSIGKTWMARFFDQAVAAIADMPDESTLAWIHCPGMNAAWDAPEEFRMRNVGPEDPAPPTGANPPRMQVEHDDPDMRFGVECAYAGQIALLDLLLDAFLNAIDSLSGETLLIVAGLRSYPLGQHNVFGLEHAKLQAETVHVPLFVRYPGQDNLGVKSDRIENHFRLQSVTQPGDVFATVADWFQLDANLGLNCSLGNCLTDPAAERQELAVGVSEQELAIRTRYWYARCYAHPAEEAAWCQLYLKPDDRWNLNDVADRCPQVVADFTGLYSDVRQALAEGDLATVEIPPSLDSPVE